MTSHDIPLDRRRVVGTLLSLVTSAAQSPAQRPDNFNSIFNSQTRQAIANGQQYLASHQNPDGSFGDGAYARNVAVTSLCGMSFLAAGSTPGRGPHGAEIRRAIEFILANSRPNGFIKYAEASSRGPMYGHGFATLFLSEVYGMEHLPDLRGKLSAAIRLIVDSQNDEGGWRYEPRRSEADISVTVCQLMALRAARNAGLHVPQEAVERAMDYVRRCQNDDGGFVYIAGRGGESEFPRSAAAVVAFHSAGIYDGPEITRALDYLQNFTPSSAQFGQMSYYFYGQYYAVQAMWHGGGTRWRQWYPKIRDVLLEQQKQDGSWFDVISPEYGTAMACLILQMPQNYLPIFRK